MTSLITIREHETIRVSDTPDDPRPHISSVRAESLVEATTPREGMGMAALAWNGRSHVKASGVVGVIATPDTTVEVLPKVDAWDDADARLNLVRMLIEAGLIEIEHRDLAGMDWRSHSLLEIFARIFLRRLATEVRRGLSRRYNGHEDDLPKLRGRLDVKRQFTRLALLPDRLACRYDELTVDTPLNRVLKAATSLLSRRAALASNKRYAYDLLDQLHDVPDMDVRSFDWSSISIDRTNRRLAPLVAIARLLLSGQRQSTASGQRSGFALLFDMASLFESWVGQTLRRRLSNQGYEVRLQGPFGWALTHEGTDAGRFRTIPDITIRRDGTCSILDTKWKLLDDTNSKLGVSQADVYQLCAYARVYEAASIALLFPHHGGLEISPGTVGRYRVVGADIPFHMISIDLSDLNQASSDMTDLAVALFAEQTNAR